MRWDQFDDGLGQLLTTIIQMRAPGMTMFRLPMTIWGMFVTAILQAFALPVLTAALCMQLADNAFGTGFFRPESAASSGGGEPLMWQHYSGSIHTRPSTS